MLIQLSLSLHFYLVYLLLNGCNSNETQVYTWYKSTIAPKKYFHLI